jgi:uncharacterized protein YfaS (alpha-2-macroglobulin family)
MPTSNGPFAIAIRFSPAIQVVFDPMGLFVPGEVVHIRGTFTDETGALADPVAVRLLLRKPREAAHSVTLTYSLLTPSTPPVVRESAGVYRVDWTIGLTDLTGQYRVRWEGDGATATTGTGENFFTVNPSAVR